MKKKFSQINLEDKVEAQEECIRIKRVKRKKIQKRSKNVFLCEHLRLSFFYLTYHHPAVTIPRPSLWLKWLRDPHCRHCLFKPLKGSISMVLSINKGNKKSYQFTLSVSLLFLSSSLLSFFLSQIKQPCQMLLP